MRGVAPGALLLLAVLAAVGAWKFLGGTPGRAGSGAPAAAGTPPAPREALSPPGEKGATGPGTAPLAQRATDAPAMPEGDPSFPEGEARAGTLRGRVVDLSGHAVAGAEVELAEGSILVKSMPALRETVGTPRHADSAGRFVLAAPHASRRYFLLARAAGYRTATFGPVVLRAEESKTLPDIVLPPGIVVEGTVTAGGRPVANARVQVSSFDDGMLRRVVVEEGPPTFTLETTTDRSGRYAFPAVPALSFRVSAGAPGYAWISRERGATDTSERTVMDLELRAAGEIRGIVLDERDRPLAGATVAAVLARDVVRCEARARCDGEGRFVLEGLAVGSYELTASAAGYLPARLPLVATGSREVGLSLVPQGAVSGVVRSAGSGAPQRSYRLQVFRHRHGRDASPTSVVLDVEDATGRFLLPGLDPGVYVLEARAPGFAPGRSESFTVVSGATVENVQIFLETGCTLRGRVVDDQRGALAEARVTLRSDGATEDDLLLPGGRNPASGAPPRTQTAPDGTFSFQHQGAGTYQILVEHPDFAPLPRNGVVLEEPLTDLGDLPLVQGGVLSGIALDLEGEPLAGATIQAATPGFAAVYGVTEADGTFLLAHLPPGDYVVQISDFQAWTTLQDLVRTAHDSAQEVSLGDGATREVVLQLAR